jgi:hypothetical protein
MLVPSPDGRHAPRIITDYDLVADGVRVDTVHTPPEAPLGEVALEDYRTELIKREAGRGTAHTITLRLKPAPSDEVQRCELFLSNMGPQIITGLAIHEAWGVFQPTSHLCVLLYHKAVILISFVH